MYALLDEVTCIDPQKLDPALARLANDPDEQIRTMARSRRVDAS
ncbi:hypothetical protein [Propionicimonas sp.]